MVRRTLSHIHHTFIFTHKYTIQVLPFAVIRKREKIETIMRTLLTKQPTQIKLQTKAQRIEQKKKKKRKTQPVPISTISSPP